VPFAFIFAPAVLLMPWLVDPSAPFDWFWFAQCAATLFMGVTALGATVVGFIGGGRLNYFERFLMGLSALFLIIPGTTTDITGMVILAALIVKQTLKYRKIKKRNAGQAAS